MPARPDLPSILGDWRRIPLPARPSRNLSGLTGGASPSRGSVSNFVMETQRKTQWCWAAVAVSIARKYNSQANWDQCRIATAHFGRQGRTLDCCGGDGDSCNTPQALNEVFAVTGNLAGDAFFEPISYEDICREITADRPFCVRIGWWPNLNSGHFVTVTGFSTGAAGEQYLDVQDPSEVDGAHDNVKRQMPFDEFRRNYDKVGGRWTWLFRTGP